MLGFIGMGNIGLAMLQGMVKGGILPWEIIAYDVNPHRLALMPENVRRARNIGDVAEHAFDIIVASGHGSTEDVLVALRERDYKGRIISVDAAMSLSALGALIPHGHIVRAMPNTACAIGEGMTMLCKRSDDVFDVSRVEHAFRACGRVEWLDEGLMGGYIALSGSSPAYFYMLLEALADAGVLQGVPRLASYRLAAQAMRGAASMVLESSIHPGTLKDAVCSPGGTTIEAVRVLEERGFRSAVIEAATACAEKARVLSQAWGSQA